VWRGGAQFEAARDVGATARRPPPGGRALLVRERWPAHRAVPRHKLRAAVGPPRLRRRALRGGGGVPACKRAVTCRNLKRICGPRRPTLKLPHLCPSHSVSSRWGVAALRRRRVVLA